MKPFAWSYSALGSFETCAHRHYRTKVAKNIPDPAGEDALWGQRVHKSLEERLRDNKPLPPSLANFEPYAARFAAAPGTLLVEQQIALNAKFEPTTWFGKDTWLRCVLDVAVLNGKRAVLADWKTGKRKPDNDQLELFAAVSFIQYPEVEHASTGFVWLKEKKMDREQYTRDDAARIWGNFLPRVARMERAFSSGTWDKKPSGLCNGWCPVKDCEFWKPKRK